MKKIKLSILLFLFFFCWLNICVAQNSDFLWTKQFGGSQLNVVKSQAADSLGNIFITGYFEGTAIFGTFTLTANGINDIYVAKIDPNGNVAWAKNFGTTSIASEGNSISVDYFGNVFVTGIFQTILVIGSNTLTSTGNEIFVTKLDNAGNVLWANQTNGGAYPCSIVTFSNGDFCLAATKWGNTSTTYYGTSALLTTGGDFLAKFDSGGSLIWSKETDLTFYYSNVGFGTGPGAPYGDRKISFDELGNIYFIALKTTTNTSAYFGNYSITISPFNSGVIFKINSSGNVIWSTLTTGTGDALVSLRSSKIGEVYCAGNFTGTIVHGTNTLTTPGSATYLSKLDVLGNYLWTSKLDGAASASACVVSIDIDTIGNCYAVGNFHGNITFGGNTATSTGSTSNAADLFLIKYDNAGNAVYFKSIPASFNAVGRSITFDLTGNVIFSGQFNSNLYIGTTTITSLGTEDISLTKVKCTDIHGTVKYNNLAVNGNAVLYKKLTNKNKYDLVATVPIIGPNSTYDFSVVETGSFIVVANPSAASLQPTYCGSAIYWKNASFIYHSCANTSTQNIIVLPTGTLSNGSGQLSGKLTEGLGYGQKGSEMSSGNPIGGISIKVGKNPSGSIVGRSITNAFNGNYLVTGLPPTSLGESYFVLVDLPGLDTAITYHKALSNINSNITNLDFTADSEFVRPVDLTVDLKELQFENGKLEVYPNPSTGQLTIHFTLLKSSEISLDLTDLSGRLVKTILSSVKQDKGEVNVSALLSEIKPGVYFVNMSIGDEQRVIKWIVTE